MKIKNLISQTLTLCASAPLRETKIIPPISNANICSAGILPAQARCSHYLFLLDALCHISLHASSTGVEAKEK